MKPSRLLPILLLLMTTWAWGQGTPSGQQPSTSQAGAGAQSTAGAPASPRAQRRAQMQALCKEHIEAMKTDVQKMHSAFDKMKANVASISNADEKTRWQANLDMWQTVVDHHEQMLKLMENAQAKGMGCGMMMGDMGMGGMMMQHPGKGPGAPPTPTPPNETKPQ